MEVGDPDIEQGMDESTLIGRLERGFGDEVLGKVDKCWIVEWSMLPSDIIVATARGAREPVLKMREYPADSLRGFFRKAVVEGNLSTTEFYRFAGFGAYNRVGALAYRIGNGSYAIPSGYDAPLAV